MRPAFWATKLDSKRKCLAAGFDAVAVAVSVAEIDSNQGYFKLHLSQTFG